MIEDPLNSLYFSAASLWELAIKRSKHPGQIEPDPRLFRRALLDNGYLELAITSLDAIQSANLVPIHKDPFDRVLIAQAMSEGMLLLTADRTLAEYGGPIELVIPSSP